MAAGIGNRQDCDRITRRTGLQTVPLEEAAQMPADQAGPDRVAEQRELQERVLEAIRALPEGQRMATTLEGYRAHFKLAVEEGCCLALVHGSQYDHGFCGFVPSFYYAVASLPVAKAGSVDARASVREACSQAEVAAGKEAFARDPYATRISAYLDGGKMHIVKQGGGAVGYLRVDPDAHLKGKEYGMHFGHVSSISLSTRDAALAVIKLAGQLADRAGFSEVCILESHMTVVTQTLLALGGEYLLRPSCDRVGLDAEMAAILDLVALAQNLQGEFQSRLNASPAHRLEARFSVGMAGTTVGFVAQAGRLEIVARKQKTHRVLPRWVLTRLFVGYYSGGDVLAMGPLPFDRSNGKTPDGPDLDMRKLELPKAEAELFRALFPKLWPCAMPDPDVWPWIIGREHPRYQHEHAKTDAMKAEIDALRFPWIGY